MNNTMPYYPFQPNEMNNYYIHENHIEIIHYIYLYNHLKSIKNKEESTNISFAHLLDLLKISLEEIELDITQINSTNHLINCSKLIKKKLQNYIDDNINVSVNENSNEVVINTEE